MALTKESYFWHKLHSLTGVIPAGLYMVQHLTLNSFSLASPATFNRVIGFFEQWPKHLLLGVEIFGLILPIFFHAIYGLFIVNRGLPNMNPAYAKWREHRYYTLQRWSGMIIFLFLIYHVLSTTVHKYVVNSATVVEYAAMQQKLQMFGGLVFVFYAIGILAATFHLAFGIWSFCIRWGITISEKSQARMWKFSIGAFFVLVALGWGALAGFLIHKPGAESHAENEIQVSRVVSNVRA